MKMFRYVFFCNLTKKTNQIPKTHFRPISAPRPPFQFYLNVFIVIVFGANSPFSHCALHILAPVIIFSRRSDTGKLQSRKDPRYCLLWTELRQWKLCIIPLQKFYAKSFLLILRNRCWKWNIFYHLLFQEFHEGKLSKMARFIFWVLFLKNLYFTFFRFFFFRLKIESIAYITTKNDVIKIPPKINLLP